MPRDRKVTTEVMADLPPPPPPPPIGDEFAMPAKEVRKPNNQLQLTEEQLNEEIAKMLRADNPVAPKALVRYIQKERCYKAEAMIVQTMTHYATDGWILHQDTEEAKKQMDQVKFEAEANKAFEASKADGGGGENFDDSKDLRNQFNFSERAAQTSSLYPKDKETITEPPPTIEISGTCCQYAIYDEYIKDQERIEEADRLAKLKQAAKKGQIQKEDPGFVKKVHKEDTNVMVSADLGLAAKVLERMVNQNTYDDIAMDFKYWDDASDQFKAAEGTLLPLWKFTNERAKKKSVTTIAWSPTYEDMFAIGYGSYDFVKPTSGLICIFSLANPTYPEYTLTTDAGVLSVDFHPQYSNLLAVGLYNGSVMVFDLARNENKPIFTSTVEIGTHSEPVWQVRWEKSQPLRFYSVSSDGRVLLWTLSKADLEPDLSMLLRIEDTDDDDGQALAGGCCFDFNQSKEDMYIVGTEEGTVHMCSKAYSSEYLSSYNGHAMAVYSVRWNLVHEDIFLSASADWTVKLWDSTKDVGAIMTFDMNNSVGDIAWAPYSSSVFAVCTVDGKVSVFDLAQQKHEPICQQKIVKKAKLTKLVFNPKHPILLVGDDRGCVTSLKLSPNLRKRSEAAGGKSFVDMEKEKLNNVIDVALKSRVREEESTD